MNHSTNPTAIQSQTWIIQVLLELLANTDYDKITVSEICRRAGLDRRTFYRNFDSKNDVLEYYIKILGSEYLSEFQAAKPSDTNEAALLFFNFWRRHLSFIASIQKCGLSNFVFMHFETFVKANQELLIGLDSLPSQLDYIFAYRIGGFWNVMLTWAANHADISPEKLAMLMTKA